ncbi:hypothetical protein [Litorisediminicola beolgyonensis]|uniref:Uncharacterized protein n=1 Tax=Litorisediminicola beolgyonensis TaxID=1173614 RepID=A0ABW3ZIH8_9RHOB
MNAPAALPSPEFERFLAALGRLNYTFTNTESLLVHLIAGLLKTGKEEATIVFLTLNTMRARIDLVDRLAKRDGCPETLRTEIVGATRALAAQAGLRNRYNHCIYAFDADSGQAKSIMMRIADRKTRLQLGEELAIDAEALNGVEQAIQAILDVNRRIWRIVTENRFPV